MHDDCPSRAVLSAFSSGNLSEQDSAELHEHLITCLDCARQLDEMTCTQLAGLGAEHAGVAQATYAAGEAVRRLILEAQGAFHDAPTAELDSTIQPGSTFAGYEVLELAGRGGMGVVLKAHDPTLQRTVAIKVLSSSELFQEELAARFLREARTIAAIEHDHVAVIHCAGQERGLPYLVMPFYSSTLEQYFGHTPQLPLAEVTRLGIQLARALEVTHAHGVLHRDIKPSNVLLEGGLERVRLADFGLAQPVSQKAHGNKRVIAGTPHYMSAEQARGDAVDVRSDLFGLGAVLYQSATGRTIYEGDSSEEILEVARRGRPTPTREANPGVPPALASIIDRLLAPRPEDRFGSAGEVVVALQQVQSSARRYRHLLRRGAFASAILCLLAVAVLVASDLSGRTAFINSLLCWRTGDGYFIRGRLGTHALLADAVKASRSGDVIEARFSGERVTGDFRLHRKAVTIRAARGFTPSLYATNNTNPFILADGPLTLEGLTLVRRSKGPAFSALVAAEGAPVMLLNCRFVRSHPQTGGDALIRDGGLIPLEESNRPSPPLIVLGAGSSGLMRNCIVVGMLGTAISMLEGDSPIQLEIENSLVATYRAYLLRPESTLEARLDISSSVFACQILMDLGNAQAIRHVTVNWTDSVINVSAGAFVRVNRVGDLRWSQAVSWNETNVVYAGEADFILDRRGLRISSEPEWSRVMKLPLNGHALTRQRVFENVRVRGNFQLNGTDVNLAGLEDASGARLNFIREVTGEGRAYDIFRERTEYLKWRGKAREMSEAWLQRRPGASAAGVR